MDTDIIRKDIEKLLNDLKIPSTPDPFSYLEISQDATQKAFELIALVEKNESRFREILTDATGYLRLAILCLAIGKLDVSAKYAEKALKSPMKGLDAKLIQGLASFRGGNFKKAIGYFDEILSADSRNWTAWFFKGEALRSRILLERAAEAYRKALDLEKGRSQLWISLGDTLTDLGRTDDAVKAYDEGTRLGDSGGKARKVQEMMGRAKLKRMSRLYETILRLAPDNIDAMLALATIHKENSDFKTAIDVYSKVLKLQPGNITAKRGLDESLKGWKKKNQCTRCGGSGKCKECKRNGDCAVCGGTGKCTLCKGSKDCIDCDGTGRCPNCGGKGKIKILRTCPVCHGNGKCPTCRGKARCMKCRGHGKCTACRGAGKCSYCNGTGDCPECGGEGWKEPGRP